MKEKQWACRWRGKKRLQSENALGLTKLGSFILEDDVAKY